MDQYCKKHPWQKLEWGNWKGSQCPICVAEKREKENDIMREEFKARKQEERIRQEKEREIERKYLQDGLIEFDTAFQNEWENVARLHTDLTSRYEQVMKKSESLLSSKFSNMLANERIPEEMISKANAEYAIQEYQDDVSYLNSLILSSSGKTIQAIKPIKSIVQLMNVIKNYSSNDTFTSTELPPSGKTLLIFSIALLLIGITCNSACGGNLEITKASFKTVVFFWPSLLIMLLFVLRTVKRNSISKKNDTLESAVTELASLLSAKILKKKWVKPTIQDDDNIMKRVLVELTEQHVFAEAAKEIHNYLWNLYLYEMISANSVSDAGRRIFSMISSDSKYDSFEDFEREYNNYKSQYEYMKATITKVGEEIHLGHRVPSRLKAKRIELLRCPSCGGPLAKDGENKCHYCGSLFNAY